MRRISRVPGGQLLISTSPVASATQAPSRMPPRDSIAGDQPSVVFRIPLRPACCRVDSDGLPHDWLTWRLSGIDIQVQPLTGTRGRTHGPLRARACAGQPKCRAEGRIDQPPNRGRRGGGAEDTFPITAPLCPTPARPRLVSANTAVTCADSLDSSSIPIRRATRHHARPRTLSPRTAALPFTCEVPFRQQDRHFRYLHTPTSPISLGARRRR